MVFFKIKDDGFFLYKMCLRFYGIWPLDRLKAASTMTYLLFLSLEVAMILSRVVDPLGQCPPYKVGDPDFTSTAWLIFSATVHLHLRLCARRMIPLIESTVDDWSLVTDSEEHRIVRRHDNFGIFFAPAYMLIMVLVPLALDIAFFVSPTTHTMFKDQRLTCTSSGSDSPIWTRAVPVIFIFINHVETLLYNSANIFFWSLTMHLCGQYQILKKQFREFLLMVGEGKRRREFRRLIERHNRLIDVGDNLEESFNFYVATQLFISQITTCLIASQLGHAIKTSHFVDMTETFSYIAILTGLQFVNYSLSEYLTTCGEDIGKILVECNWYDLSKDSIMNFSIVIARSQRPTRMTAAKLYKLNHYNFTYLLQSVYSYVSLIVAITKN